MKLYMYCPAWRRLFSAGFFCSYISYHIISHRKRAGEHMFAMITPRCKRMDLSLHAFTIPLLVYLFMSLEPLVPDVTVLVHRSWSAFGNLELHGYTFMEHAS